MKSWVSQYFYTCVLRVLMISLVFLTVITLLFIPTFGPYTAGLHHLSDEEEHYSMPRCGQ